MGEPLSFRELEAARFATCFAYIQKYFALVLVEREREHIGFVGLLAVLLVHFLCERIATDDERKLKTRAKNGTRDFFKRNIRGRGANSMSYVEHYRLVSERNECSH